MKTTPLRAALISLLLAVFARASDTDGFVSVFNGQDLRGWIGATQSYAVESGVLYSLPDKAGNMMLEQQYADFVLLFDFLLTTNANNGVALRMKEVDGDGIKSGTEIQILDDEGDAYKKLADFQYNGSLYGIAPAKRGFLKPVGQWNTQEVRAIGSRVTVILNGMVIVDQDFKDIQKTPDGKDHQGMRNAKGYIGLRAHHSRVGFRNLRVKALN